METLNLDLTKQYTLEDYLQWADNVRRELINGFIHFFAAPHSNHQLVELALYKNLIKIENEFNNLLILVAPIDLILDWEGEKKYKNKILDVCQPDVLICNKNQIHDGKCYGAPLFIAEILSNSNKRKDKIDKFLLYEKYKVPEYWIINYKFKIIECYNYEENGYSDGDEYSGEDCIC
jgi:Uma2 family endonuclease